MTSSPNSRAAGGLARRRHRSPFGEDAFRLSTLDWSERERHAPALALHKDLLTLRREDPVFAAQDLGQLAGAVLSPQALVSALLGSERTATG